MDDKDSGNAIPQEIDNHFTDVKDKSEIVTKVERGFIKPLTETQKLKITPAMLKWVDTAVELITDAPATIAANCKVSRQSWYHWCTLAGFEDWFYTEYKNRRRKWIPTLDAMGMARAPKNYDYWAAMNRKAGDPVEGDGATNITGTNVVAILGGMSNSTTNNIKEDTQPLAKASNSIIDGEATDDAQ
jgi:hypothetical protein